MSDAVELVFFEGCPHVEGARQRLREALALVGRDSAWAEWDSTRSETPARYRGLASPTVLVGGADVRGAPVGAGVGCAVGGGPTVGEIVTALRAGAP